MEPRLQEYLLKLFGNQPMEPMATAANAALAAREIPEAPNLPEPEDTRLTPPPAAPLDMPSGATAGAPTMPAAGLKPGLPAPVAKPPVTPPMAQPPQKYGDDARQALYDSLAQKRQEGAGWEAVGNVADLNSRVGGGTPLNAHAGMVERRLGDEKTAKADFEAGAGRETDVRNYLEKKLEKERENTRLTERDAATDKYHQDSLAVQREALAQKAGKKAESTGEKSVDKQFAADYNDYVLQGGRRGIEGNFKRLDQSIQALKDLDPGIVGRGIAAATPEMARGIIQPRYKSIEQDARANVLGVLRATLGAAFTEKEGERIFSQTFDPSLPAATNLSRLATLRSSLAKQAGDKQAAIDYYEEHGTLSGFKSGPQKMKDAAQAPAAPSGDARRAKIAQLRKELGK